MSIDLRKDWFSLFLIAIIVVLGIEVVMLIQQNHELKKLVESPRQFYRTLQKEDTVPSIYAEDPEGQRDSLIYSPTQPYTLQFWFSTGCHSCLDNLEIWNKIYSKFRSDRFKIIGICNDYPEQVRAFMDQHKIEFPVLCLSDDDIIDAYQGYVVPQTMLVSPVGSLVEIWSGQFADGQLESLRSILSAIESTSRKGGESK